MAATKRDLRQLVAEKKFRDDLMYRLSVVQVEIPPLRERREEIPSLAEYFLKTSLAKLGRPYKHFSRDALDKMSSFDWPGNVRELEHVIEGLVAVHQGEEIRANDLPLSNDGNSRNTLFALNTSGCDSVKLDEAVAEFERALLSWALERANGNQAKAAQMLNIPRSTLQYRWARLSGNLGANKNGEITKAPAPDKQAHEGNNLSGIFEYRDD